MCFHSAIPDSGAFQASDWLTRKPTVIGTMLQTKAENGDSYPGFVEALWFLLGNL